MEVITAEMIRQYGSFDYAVEGLEDEIWTWKKATYRLRPVASQDGIAWMIVPRRQYRKKAA